MLRSHDRRGIASRAPIEPLEGRILFAAGAPDTSFGGDGIATINHNLHDEGIRVAAQPDGKVIAVGTTSTNDVNSRDFLVVRFNADGTPDATFGNGGVVQTDFGGTRDIAEGVALLPDGRFVVVGGAEDDTRSITLWAVARYLPNGALDTSFSGDGKDTRDFDFLGLPGPMAVELQPDGKAVVAGSSENQVGVARYNVDGTLDSTFGGDGLVQTPVSSAFAYAQALDVAPDGRIVAVGVYPGNGGARGIVVRYLSNGQRDASFSGDGISYVKDDGAVPYLWGVEVQADNKLVVLQEDFTLRRLKAGGGDDTTFGTAGVARVPVPQGGMVFARSLVQQPDGKFVAGGMATNPTTGRTEAMLVRYTAGGKLDTTFGANGVARLADPDHPSISMVGIDLAPGGKVVGAGTITTPSGNDFTRDVAAYRFLGDDSQQPPPPPPPLTTWTLQAEDTERSSGTVVGRSHVGFTGSGYLDFVGNSGASADWIVQDTPGAGVYTIQFRYANGSPSARQMAFDAFPAHASGLLSFAPTGSWSTWQTLTVQATMLQGSPALPISLITTGQNGPNIDKITVSYQPLPSEDQTYQAENAALVGARVASNHVGYTGTGFADFTNARGDSITWNVFPHEGGRHLLVFRYANGGLSDRALQLSVNGDVLSSLSFAPTGSWSTWREVSLEWNLLDGGDELKLSTVGNNGPNVDVLTVRPLRD